MINVATNIGLAGFYTVRKKCATSGKVKQEVGPFHNLITNLGLNWIGTIPPYFSHCYVGTGTVPPAVGDTTMSTYKVTSNSAGSFVNTAPTSPTWFAQVSRTFTFNAGTINGNITEVGVGWNPTPVGSLWSRELIVDSSGNPIAITVLANEILEVVYTFRQYIDPEVFTGSFTLNGINYNYTGCAGNVGSAYLLPTEGMRAPFLETGYANATGLGSITTSGLSGGTQLGGSPSHSQRPYVNNSYSLSGVSSLALGTWNHASGINGFSLYGAASAFMAVRFKILLATPIPKTNLNTMSLTWSITWGRYTPPSP